MDADFEDIRIVDLDLSRTTWSRVHDSLRVMFLRLDRAPPDNDWPRLFFEERESRIVARRRGLWIEDDYISFDSLPGEVEKIHLPDIRQSLNYANRRYRELAAQRRRKRLDSLAEQRGERDEMLALQARLRGMFDGERALAEASAMRADIAPDVVSEVVPERVPDTVVEPAAPAATPPADAAARDVLDEFERRRNALKQAFRNAASQDKEQK